MIPTAEFLKTKADPPYECGGDRACPGCPGDDPVTQADLLDDALLDCSREALPVLYLSGPMSGLPAFNFPFFNETARQFRLLGFPVLNPADFGARDDQSWEFCIARDLQFMTHAQIVVVLPDWEESKGANVEVDVARALSIPVLTIPCFMADVVPRYYSPAEIAAITKLDAYRNDFIATVRDVVEGEGTGQEITIEPTWKATRRERIARIQKEIDDRRKRYGRPE
jgi:hypothetical protein